MTDENYIYKFVTPTNIYLALKKVKRLSGYVWILYYNFKTKHLEIRYFCIFTVKIALKTIVIMLSNVMLTEDF